MGSPPQTTERKEGETPTLRHVTFLADDLLRMRSRSDFDRVRTTVLIMFSGVSGIGSGACRTGRPRGLFSPFSSVAMSVLLLDPQMSPDSLHLLLNVLDVSSQGFDLSSQGFQTLLYAVQPLIQPTL